MTALLKLFVLTSSIFILYGCKKKKNTPSVLQSYVTKMGGKRIWQGTYDYKCWNCMPTYEDGFNFTDTFGITGSDSIINFTVPYPGCHNNCGEETLRFLSMDSEKLIYKWEIAGTDEQITYYYNKDSIVFFGHNYDKNQGEYINLTTP